MRPTQVQTWGTAPSTEFQSLTITAASSHRQARDGHCAPVDRVLASATSYELQSLLNRVQMSHAYHNTPIQFLYPENWQLNESRNRDGLTVSLQSSYSMFLFLNYYDRAVAPAELANEALQTMADEYPELDANPVAETIADQSAVGHDVSFFSLDLTNTCWIRAFSAGEHAVLIFAQTSDLDLERAEQAFRGVCASLKLDTTRAG